MAKVLLSLLISICFGSGDQNNPFMHDIKGELKPHIIDHPNPGCPTNAECSPQAGKLISSFKKLLKQQDWKRINNFKNKSGIPLDVWSRMDLNQPMKDPLLISWDSHCPNHQKEKPVPINISWIFAKDFSTLKKKDYIEARRLILHDGKTNEVIHGLRDGSPLYFSYKGTHYIRELDGHYFEIVIHKNGRFELQAPKRPVSYPETIPCPDDLSSIAGEKILVKNLYQGIFCQKIWHSDKKKFETIVQGHECL